MKTNGLSVMIEGLTKQANQQLGLDLDPATVRSVSLNKWHDLPEPEAVCESCYGEVDTDPVTDGEPILCSECLRLEELEG